MSAPSTHWPDDPAFERARDALGHVTERASEVRNAKHLTCSTCGRELSTRWRKVGARAYLCAACVERQPGPDRDALAALGISGDDVTTMDDDQWTRVLIAALATRRQQGVRR